MLFGIPCALFLMCYGADFETDCLASIPLISYDMAHKEDIMNKLLLVAALAGGLAFGGFAATAKADPHRHGNYRGHNHGHSHNWNRGYRGGYNNNFRYRGNYYGNGYRPRSGVTLQFNYGRGYRGYGYGNGFGYGGGYYNNFNNCW